MNAIDISPNINIHRDEEPFPMADKKLIHIQEIGLDQNEYEVGNKDYLRNDPSFGEICKTN